MGIETDKPRQSHTVANFLRAARYFLAAFFILAGYGASTSHAEQERTAKNLTPKDYVEIYQLYSAYSNALDTGNGAARIATFTPDGTFSSYLSKHAKETMDVLLKRTNAYGQKKVSVGGHMLVNIHLTPTPAGADGTCYAILAGDKPGSDGRYDLSPAFYTDTLVKTSAGWRFKSREVFIGTPGDANY